MNTTPLHDDAYIRGVAFGFPDKDSRRTTLLEIARRVQERNETYDKPENGWTCFHCGETFTTPGAARDHFGSTQDAVAACRIKAGAEKGILMALRKAENDLAHYREEDQPVMHEMARLQSKHSDALRDAEELGYERGLKDGMSVAAESEPVARLHIRLEDDGLDARVQVLDGEQLQVADSPVDLYLHPASVAAGSEPVAWLERMGSQRHIAWQKDDNHQIPLYLHPASVAAGSEPVAEVHPSHLRAEENGQPWCREVLLYSGNSPHDFLNGENYRVKLYLHPASIAAGGEPLSDSYIQKVPDKCDRIIWRGMYYHLPLGPASTPEDMVPKIQHEVACATIVRQHADIDTIRGYLSATKQSCERRGVELAAALADNERLLGVVEEVHSWAVCGAITTPEDMMQNLPRIVEITTTKGETL